MTKPLHVLIAGGGLSGLCLAQGLLKDGHTCDVFERDSDLSFIEYHALARLSEEPDHRLRMSDLAAVTNASLSRLSHLIKRLESWGFVRRETDPTDGRFTIAILTDAGYAKLVASAPAHVACVRQLVIDEFSASELAQLRAACDRIVARVDASAWKQELN